MESNPQPVVTRNIVFMSAVLYLLICIGWSLLQSDLYWLKYLQMHLRSITLEKFIQPWPKYMNIFDCW